MYSVYELTSFSISGASTNFFFRVFRNRRFLQFFSGGPMPWGQRYFLSTYNIDRYSCRFLVALIHTIWGYQKENIKILKKRRSLHFSGGGGGVILLGHRYFFSTYSRGIPMASRRRVSDLFKDGHIGPFINNNSLLYRKKNHPKIILFFTFSIRYFYNLINA